MSLREGVHGRQKEGNLGLGGGSKISLKKTGERVGGAPPTDTEVWKTTRVKWSGKKGGQRV